MTAKSRLPLFIYQKYFEIKDHLTTFLRKLEVIANSSVIINVVRLLIVMIALLMGYAHAVKKKEITNRTNKTEIYDSKSIPVDPF